MSDFFLILLTALLASVSCSLVGLHIILRKQAMMSDALSHSVLPGLVLVYVFFNQLTPSALFVGALGVSAVMALLMEFIRQQKLLREDAAMGLVFSTLFALGVFLLENFASKVHIDIDCLLYGELTFVPLEKLNSFLGVQLPQSTYLLLISTLLILVLCFVFHKELMITAFHEDMAKSMGLPTRTIQFALMTGVAIAVMASFRSLGAILVIAFLILPGAFGSLFSKSFKGIYVIGLVYIFSAVYLGVQLAYYWNNNMGAMIVSVAFVGFLLAFAIRSLWNRKSEKIIEGRAL